MKLSTQYFADIDFALRHIRTLVMEHGIAQLSLAQDEDDIWVVVYPDQED